jgi:hypothetical protein
VLEWQADALVRAREEARVEGELHGPRIAVIGVLEARFQTVPADLIAAIRSLADPQKLSSLIPLAARSPTLNQFRGDAGL